MLRFFPMKISSVLAVLAVCLVTAASGAPAGGESAGGAGAQISFLEILRDTGLMVYPLALLSVVTVFLVLYYAFSIRQGTVVSDKFMQTADVLLRKDDYIGLLDICERRNDCISRVAEKMLEFLTKNPEASFEKVREVGEAEGSRQASLLTQRITYLADVGSIAPMLGLLGTVMGMIKAFREIGALAVFADKQTGLATGVSEALLTTAGGLLVGIPALIFYSLFRGRVQRLISDLEAASTHILVLLEGVARRGRAPVAGRRYAASRRSYEPELEPDMADDYYHAPRSLGRRTIDPDQV